MKRLAQKYHSDTTWVQDEAIHQLYTKSTVSKLLLYPRPALSGRFPVGRLMGLDSVQCSMQGAGGLAWSLALSRASSSSRERLSSSLPL